MFEYLILAGFFGACFAAALSGAFFPPDDWYKSLEKPPWCPPNWLFAPAWTILYVMIAVAGWLVWRAAGFAGAWGALTLFGVQLVFNAGWSAVFFGLRRLGWALVEVTGLWLSIAATIAAFAAISETAAWMLVPYLAWVTFAATLNASIWRRNPGNAPAGRALLT